MTAAMFATGPRLGSRPYAASQCCHTEKMSTDAAQQLKYIRGERLIEKKGRGRQIMTSEARGYLLRKTIERLVAFPDDMTNVVAFGGAERAD